jgi:hypothetical protein
MMKAANVANVIQRVSNQIVLLIGLATFDISVAIDNSTYFFAVLAAGGAFLGSLARLIRRDKADVEDKIKYFYGKDIFELFVWTLVGGFFPLAFASVGWLPGLGVIISPFMPKAFDFMEENLPQAVLGTVLKTGKLIETLIESRKNGGNAKDIDKDKETNNNKKDEREETKQ